MKTLLLAVVLGSVLYLSPLRRLAPPAAAPAGPAVAPAAAPVERSAAAGEWMWKGRNNPLETTESKAKTAAEIRKQLGEGKPEPRWVGDHYEMVPSNVSTANYYGAGKRH